MNLHERLLKEAASFERRIKSLDEDAILARILDNLGIAPSDSGEKGDRLEMALPVSGRIQRPDSAGDPGRTGSC
ncbi:hypothetical protein [Nonomuraea typhae]|uniref:Uncharacterized protein n=1 Tax=Nonomuraea typhae TaxID=2603600 RepID=A0ABW7Z8R1_9ACTN